MIYGIQKLSLVDYPSLPSFVIFLGGCNFRCPFCHNASIVEKQENTYEIEDVLNEIKKRTAFLNAVVVTGGEPTIYGSKIPYEFRMTINKTMHQKNDILEVLSYIKNKDRFFLQPYKHQPTQIQKQNFGEFNKEEIKELEESFHIKT